MVSQSTIFLSGICGSGMKPLALVAAKQGYRVMGTDRGYADDALMRDARITVQKEPDPEVAAACDHYVFSSAIASDHPERMAATASHSKNGSPAILHRMELLNLLVAPAPLQFALAGTHGKTSSTSMAGWLLLQAGLDPTIIAGGRPLYLPEGCRSGAGETAVYETDESDGSFLSATGRHRLILNVDHDHLNHYGSFEALCSAFARFAGGGRPVMYAADVVLAGIARELATTQASSLGSLTTAGAALFGPDETEAGHELSRHMPFYAGQFDERDALFFRVVEKDRVRFDGTSGRMRLNVPGRHFAMNALGVLALVHSAIREESALARRFDPDDPRTLSQFVQIMNEFPGVERRLQTIGRIHGAPVYDDYGHHPTEIRAVLDALSRRGERPLCVVFQPHRYTRTRDLAAEFASSLSNADRVYLLPLYSAGEPPIPGITSESIASLMNGRAHSLQPGELHRVFAEPWGAVLFLGAGSISSMARKFMEDGR